MPGDEDRGGGGAIAPDDETKDDVPTQDGETETEGGTGSDDGGPGSRNM